MRTTHTYAILEVSPVTYNEIKEKLLKADYGDQFHEHEGNEVIDLHGIAIQASTDTPTPSDLQARLRCIERAASELRAMHANSHLEKELAYLVGYLADILHKHLSTGEV